MKRVTATKIFFTAFFGTPISAGWILGTELHGSGNRRKAILFRSFSIGITMGLFIALFLIPVNWKVSSGIWAGFLVFSAMILAISVHFLNLNHPRPEPADGWARRSLLAIPVLFAVMIPIDLFCHIALHVIFKPILIHHPIFMQNTDYLAKSILSAFLTSIWGVVFLIVSFRIGRLVSSHDFLKAVIAWMYGLFLKMLLANWMIEILIAQLYGVDAPFSIAGLYGLLAGLFFSIALPFIVLELAWGQEPLWRRFRSVTGTCIAAAMSMIILFGLTPWIECAVGKSFERNGRPNQALTWYGRSLVRRSNPYIISYLQHRIGLINYKKGNIDKAITSFKMLQTLHDANHQLVKDANIFMDRLSETRLGERVVLPGVENDMEYQSAYCAPNTLALIFNFWGKTMTVSDIGEDIALHLAGTRLTDIVHFCCKNGLEHLFIPFMTMDDIRFIIDQGVPFIAYLPGHVLAVFGYDDRLNTLIVFDTATWDVWVDHPMMEFFEIWSYTNYTGAVILDAEEKERTAAIRSRFDTPPAESAWYYQQAMESTNNLDKTDCLRNAIQTNPLNIPALIEVDLSFPSMRSMVDLPSQIDKLIPMIKSIIHRSYFANWDLLAGFSSMLLNNGKFSEMRDLYQDIKTLNIDISDHETRVLLDSIETMAGIAAWKTGDSLQAQQYIGSKQKRLKGREWYALGIIQQESGLIEDAKNSFGYAIKSKDGDIASMSVNRLEALTDADEPAFLIELYRAYLLLWPYDAQRWIRLGDLCLDALEKSGKSEEERLVQARQAYSLARGLTQDPDARQHCRTQLEKIKTFGSSNL